MRPEIPEHVDVELEQTEIHALAVDVLDSAHAVGVEDPLHLDDRRVVHEGVPDHERLSRALGGSHDRLRVADGAGERLLDENVLPGGERLLGELAVGSDRSRDAHRVDRAIVEELVMGGRRAHRREALAYGLEPLLGEIRDRDRLGPGHLAQVADEVRSPVTRTDDSDAQRFIQANTRSSYGTLPIASALLFPERK